MNDADAAGDHHSLQITQAQVLAQIPAQARQDHLLLEKPPSNVADRREYRRSMPCHQEPEA
ncbi:hypothetical protein ATY79_26455 [Rhizobium sp. R693]|nr:hypothetical protein ATY79_26455 [Rhizobium sp. R693]